MRYIICPRCSGHGTIEKYKHVEAGICFECGGSGKVTEDEALRIEKDIAKELKRTKTKAENSKQKLIDSLKKQWFNNNDIIYMLNDNNTYNRREQLKQDGAIFNYNFKVWYYLEPKENTFSIMWDEVLNDNNKGYATRLIELIQEKSNNNLKGY